MSLVPATKGYNDYWRPYHPMVRSLTSEDIGKAIMKVRPSVLANGVFDASYTAPDVFCLESITFEYPVRGFCNHCGKKSSLQCGRCKNAFYCNQGCQSKDWKRKHRNVCKANSAKQRIVGMKVRKIIHPIQNNFSRFPWRNNFPT